MNIEEIAEREFYEKAAEENLSPESRNFGILKKEFISGYCAGFAFYKSLVPIDDKSISSKAWDLSKEYLLDQNREHHLSFYFEKAITEQIEIDRELTEKRFSAWLEKAIEKCYELYKVLSRKTPEEKVVVDKDELIKEIKGIEL